MSGEGDGDAEGGIAVEGNRGWAPLGEGTMLEGHAGVEEMRRCLGEETPRTTTTGSKGHRGG